MAKQFSTVRDGRIEYALWLTFDRFGNVRMSRGEPRVGRHERSVSLMATLPMSLFDVPTLRGTLTVEDTSDGLGANLDILAAVDALKGALGVDIDLKVSQTKEGTQNA